MTQVIDFVGGEYRNRTGVHGFAIRCITTLPTRRRCGVVGNIASLSGLQERTIAFHLCERCCSQIIVARRV